MPVHSRANQYRGVNAHFNSYAQNEEDGWSSFHTRYIVALGDVIDVVLPPGYEISWETSLQIREYDPNTGEPISRPKKPEPDITVWDIEARIEKAMPMAEMGSGATPTLVQPVVEILSRNDELYYRAVVVYQVRDERIPVARFEFLSPSNKPGGSNYTEYVAKQDMALRAGGVTLIVVDFLHQSPSPIPNIPSYPDREPGAYPYNITVVETRPSLKKGQAKTYGFRVDDLIPVILIPLSGDDRISVDFGNAYNIAYRASSSFSNRADYSEKPVAFETYDTEDRKRILARMEAVKRAYDQGLDLEKAPFPLEI